MASEGIKIAELGKELNVDPRQIVAAAKDMAMENAKVPASWVTFGQAERLRAKFGGQKHLKAALERKQRAKEESATPQPPEAPTPQPVKLGKKTFEGDRRKLFGVVATPGGVRLDRRENEKIHAVQAKATPVAADAPSGSSPAPVSSVETEPANAVTPPKKVLEIKVSPPVRRQGQQDPRFGVVVPAPDAPAPEVIEPKTRSEMWGKLDDGRPHPEFETQNAPSPEPEPEPEPEQEAPKPTIATVDPEDLDLVPDPKSVIPSAQEAREEESFLVPEEVELPVRATRAEKISSPPEPVHTPARRTVEEVAVKRQPEHKAFGAKHKLKAKHHKKLKAAELHKPKRHSKEKPEERASPAPHAPRGSHEKINSPARSASQKPGLLQRLVRKLFKK